MKMKHLLKKAFLLLALVGGVNSAWAADYTVTATRVLSNSDKTCTWSAITANDGNAIQSSATALGDGLYFVAVGKITLNGGGSLNVKVGGEMYIEVPSASSAGTVKFTNGVNNRYMETKSGGKVHMKGDSDNGDYKAQLAFTSDDIVEVDGVNYLKLTSQSDCKFQTVSITLTSGTFPSLGVPEITAVSICGNAISASDLATLKSTHALSVAGSTVNGMPGTINVTVKNGATTVTRTISGTSAIYSFTVNAIDYTVTITDVDETYTALGCMVAYSGEELKSFTTADGITFTMVADKTFQYGAGSVTISGDDYKPLKLSTGSAVNVTFPANKVATKVRVYCWSAEGNGKLASMSETNGSAKSVTVNSDVFYAKNTASDIYPTVYEYDLDNWESLYFNPSGSPSQPFVVMDFVLADKTVSKTITSAGYATFCSDKALDFSGVAGLTAYIITGTESGNTLALSAVSSVPANTGVLLEGAAGDYMIPVVSTSSTDVSENKLVGVTEDTPIAAKAGYVLMGSPSVGFYKNNNEFTVGANTAYLPANFAGGAAREAYFFDGVTGVEAVEAAPEAVAKEGKFVVNGKLRIFKKGKMFNANGQLVK